MSKTHVKNAHLNLFLCVALLLEVALLGQLLQPQALLVSLHVAGRRALGELLAYLLRQALVPALDALRKSSTVSCWRFAGTLHAWQVLNNQNLQSEYTATSARSLSDTKKMACIKRLQ